MKAKQTIQINTVTMAMGTSLIVAIGNTFSLATDKIREAAGLPKSDEEFSPAWAKLNKTDKEIVRKAFYASYDEQFKAAVLEARKAKKEAPKKVSASTLKRYAQSILPCRAERSDKGKGKKAKGKDAAMEAAVKKCDSAAEAKALCAKVCEKVFSK